MCRYMTYTAASEQFHTFEAQNCIVGLSFTDCNEANEFMAKVKSMLPSPNASSLQPNHATPSAVAAASRKKSSFFSRLFNKSETPMAIGMPTDFVHKQHIGYDPDKGFQSTDIPAEWASIFKNAGIRRKDLQNPEIASVIYSTLQSQLGGSMELGGQHLSIATSGPTFHPHPPTSLPHQPQPHSPQPPSPSVPARPMVHPLREPTGGQKGFVPTPPGHMPPPQRDGEEYMDDAHAPPPPPPLLSSGSSAAPPPPPPQSSSSVPPPPPTLSADIPAAPEIAVNAPIPPPFAPSIPPPPPPSSSSSPPSPTASAAQLEHKSPSPPPVMDHLAAIKSGVTLKKVARPQADNALPDVSGLNREEATTLTSVLQNAMKARLRNIQAVEDDDEHDNDDDGWD